ncbi:MAG TPA: alpha/beta hydrolase [Candidatus Bathyarchaeia archaeon]|nr:alpha/beta hydrolase [Candidatus Bathyarchaeia archaeon]
MSDVEVSGSVYKISATNPTRWYRSAIEVGIALSLIALTIIFINCTPQVGYGLATQFSLGTFNHTGLEKNTKAFLDSLQQKGGPPIYTLTPEKARAVLSEIQASTPVKKLSAIIENRTIPGGPGGKEISITIVRPANSNNQTLPVAMYFHGGGWVLGGFDTHERLVRELANKANVVIVFINYTPSPEARYPVANEQVYAATKWVAENGRTINVNSSRLAVVGDSVGGNMVAAVTLLAKERGGPPIKFQVLFYPVTDATFDTPSYLTYQNGYWLTRDGMKWFWSNYLTNQTNVKDPTVSPLQASIEQLKGLPPALVINGENDVLRDEGEAYALKLSEAGVPVTAVRYHGTIHDFVMLNAITDDPAPRGAIEQASIMLKNALSG